MNKVICYFQTEKRKSHDVMHAFAQGCPGAVLRPTTDPKIMEPGAVAFYGVRPPWKALWDQAKAEGRRIYYVDNSYFDVVREKQFRIGINAIQSWSRRPSDGARLAKLGVRVQPWRKGGKYIMLVPQTQEFMATVCGVGSWIDGVQAAFQEAARYLKAKDMPPLYIRRKGDQRAFHDDLMDASMVVAHGSAAAVEALIAGVPVIVTDREAAAFEFTSEFTDILSPNRPENRLEWLGRLAESQWSLEEFRNGSAWKAIHDGRFEQQAIEPPRIKSQILNGETTS